MTDAFVIVRKSPIDGIWRALTPRVSWTPVLDHALHFETTTAARDHVGTLRTGIPTDEIFVVKLATVAGRFVRQRGSAAPV